jgi:hypothetical protein
VSVCWCQCTVSVVVGFSSPTHHTLPLACISSVMPRLLPFGVTSESQRVGYHRATPRSLSSWWRPMQVPDEVPVHVEEFCTDVGGGVAVDGTMAAAAEGGGTAREVEGAPVGLLTPHSLRRPHVSRGDSRVAVLTVRLARVAGLGDQVHLEVEEAGDCRVADRHGVVGAH